MKTTNEDYAALLIHCLVRAGRYEQGVSIRPSPSADDRSVKLDRAYAFLKLGKWPETYRELSGIVLDENSKQLTSTITELKYKIAQKQISQGRIDSGMRLLKEAVLSDEEQSLPKDLQQTMSNHSYAGLFLGYRDRAKSAWETQIQNDPDNALLYHNLAIFYYSWATYQEDCLNDLVELAIECNIPLESNLTLPNLVDLLSDHRIPNKCFRKGELSSKCIHCRWEYLCRGQIANLDSLWMRAISFRIAVLNTDKYWQELVNNRVKATKMKFSAENVEKSKELLTRDLRETLHKYQDQYGEKKLKVHFKRFSHYLNVFRWEMNATGLRCRMMNSSGEAKDSVICGPTVVKNYGIKDINICHLSLKNSSTSDDVTKLQILFSEYGLISSCIEAGKYQWAIEYLDQLPQTCQNTARWRSLSGQALIGQGRKVIQKDFSEGEQLLLEIKNSYPEEYSEEAGDILINAYKIYALEVLNQNNPYEAVQIMERAINCLGQRSDFVELLIVSYNKAGWSKSELNKFEQSIAYFKKALAFDKTFTRAKQGIALAYNGLALALMNEEKFSEAMIELEKGLDYDPGHETIRKNMAWAIINSVRSKLELSWVDNDESIEILRKALSYSADDEKICGIVQKMLKSLGSSL